MNHNKGRGFETVVDFPDLAAGWRRLRNKLPVGLLLIVLAVLVVLATGIYTVDPEERGVILRFGAFVRTAEPGLHFKLPLGIESVEKVPVQRQLKEEFGFRTASAGVRTEYSQQDFDGESLMLTGDLNIADVEWVVQYRIVDPESYLFRVRNVRETFRGMTEAVMREVVGDRTVNEVITVGRQELMTLVEGKLQELCDQYETGLNVEQVVLQNVYPPDEVRDSFNEVNRAEQEKQATINEAESDYNREVPLARGEAQRTIERAEGYAIDRVNRAEGDASRFNALYTEYRKAPEVTRTRIYLETLQQVLTSAGRNVVVDDELQGVFPLLGLDAQGAPQLPRQGGDQ